MEFRFYAATPLMDTRNGTATNSVNNQLQTLKQNRLTAAIAETCFFSTSCFGCSLQVWQSKKMPAD